MPELYPITKQQWNCPIIKKLKVKLITKCAKIKSITYTYVKLSVLKFIKIAGNLIYPPPQPIFLGPRPGEFWAVSAPDLISGLDVGTQG